MRDSTINRHFGFFIRPDIGGGYMSSSASGLTISGPAASFGVAIGGAVMENIILSGHLYDSVIVNPSVSSGGLSASTSDTTLAMVGIGPELTYYFMPSNMYLSATLALTNLSLTRNNLSAKTNDGFGGKLAFGKEWWTGDHWGLGVAGQFSYASNSDSGAGSPTWSTWGLGLAFSATYN